MRVLRAAAAVAVASGIALAVPATAHADDVRARQWYLTTLKLAKVHEQATGDGVRVGLVDSGIDPTHQDLDGAVADNRNFGENTGGPGGNQGSGTATATILAGRGHDDDAGILGVAPDAELVTANVLGAAGPDRVDLIVEAISHLIDEKVDIITVGLFAPDSEKLRTVTQKAAKNGIPVVAAAGVDETGDTGYPVGSKGAVNALGSDKEGNPADDAGAPAAAEAITIAAPSQEMQLATPGDGYGVGGDPAFAAAIVAGTMALVKEKQPDLTGEDLIAVVRDSASGKGDFDEELGYGIVDPSRAITTEATGSSGPVTGSVLDNDNTTLALIIAAAGVLGLAALVVVVRSRDARIRRFALAGAPAAPTDPGVAPTMSDTGTMPRLSDTGTFPRVTDTPPHGTPGTHTPPYGHNAPGR